MKDISLTNDLLSVGADAGHDPAVVEAGRNMRDRLRELEALSNGPKYGPNIRQQQGPRTGEWLFSQPESAAWEGKGNPPLLGICGRRVIGEEL
jgi:hypothetical protein